MVNTIEHAFNGFALLHTAHRLLRQGGLFIFQVRVEPVHLLHLHAVSPTLAPCLTPSQERIVKINATAATFSSIETHPIRMQQAAYDWLFQYSGVFSRHRKFRYYADAGRRPKKKFIEEIVGYLAYKA